MSLPRLILPDTDKETLEAGVLGVGLWKRLVAQLKLLGGGSRKQVIEHDGYEITVEAAHHGEQDLGRVRVEPRWLYTFGMDGFLATISSEKGTLLWRRGGVEKPTESGMVEKKTGRGKGRLKRVADPKNFTTEQASKAYYPSKDRYLKRVSGLIKGRVYAASAIAANGLKCAVDPAGAKEVSVFARQLDLADGKPYLVTEKHANIRILKQYFYWHLWDGAAGPRTCAQMNGDDVFLISNVGRKELGTVDGQGDDIKHVRYKADDFSPGTHQTAWGNLHYAGYNTDPERWLGGTLYDVQASNCLVTSVNLTKLLSTIDETSTLKGEVGLGREPSSSGSFDVDYVVLGETHSVKVKYDEKGAGFDEFTLFDTELKVRCLSAKVILKEDSIEYVIRLGFNSQPSDTAWFETLDIRTLSTDDPGKFVWDGRYKDLTVGFRYDGKFTEPGALPTTVDVHPLYGLVASSGAITRTGGGTWKLTFSGPTGDYLCKLSSVHQGGGDCSFSINHKLTHIGVSNGKLSCTELPPSVVSGTKSRTGVTQTQSNGSLSPEEGTNIDSFYNWNSASTVQSTNKVAVRTVNGAGEYADDVGVLVRATPQQSEWRPADIVLERIYDGAGNEIANYYGEELPDKVRLTDARCEVVIDVSYAASRDEDGGYYDLTFSVSVRGKKVDLKARSHYPWGLIDPYSTPGLREWRFVEKTGGQKWTGERRYYSAITGAAFSAWVSQDIDSREWNADYILRYNPLATNDRYMLFGSMSFTEAETLQAHDVENDTFCLVFLQQVFKRDLLRDLWSFIDVARPTQDDYTKLDKQCAYLASTHQWSTTKGASKYMGEVKAWFKRRVDAPDKVGLFDLVNNMSTAVVNEVFEDEAFAQFVILGSSCSIITP